MKPIFVMRNGVRVEVKPGDAARRREQAEKNRADLRDFARFLSDTADHLQTADARALMYRESDRIERLVR